MHTKQVSCELRGHVSRRNASLFPVFLLHCALSFRIGPHQYVLSKSINTNPLNPKAMKNKALSCARPLAFVLLMLVVMPCSLLADQVSRWHNPTAPIYKVFKQEREGVVEVIKLFKDGRYDHITYTYGNTRDEHLLRNLCMMQRDTGVYTESLGRLVLKQADESSAKDKIRNSYWMLGGKSLYASPVSMLTHYRQPDFEEAKGRNYRMPFYIEPRLGVIVDNPESMDRVDLEELVFYVTKGASGEQSKFLRIANFIMNSISYAHSYLKGAAPKDAAYTTTALLAGPYRQGVCADYAKLAKDLCELAKVDCRVVGGAARNSLGDINMNVSLNHDWNILNCKGKQEIYDLTWEDSFHDGRWMAVDPAVMIYTHFPEKKANQLLATPMEREAFNKSPILEPTAAKAHIAFSFPTVAKLYTDSDLVITMKGSFARPKAPKTRQQKG